MSFEKGGQVMKSFLAVLMMFCVSAAWSADQSAPAPATVVKGEVVEVKDVESYTYVRLKTADGETWAAVPTAPLKKGAKITLENTMVMNNFESKTLKKKFDKIVFGTIAGADAKAGGAAATAHSGASKTEYAGDVKVPKATGPDAKTVAEIITKSTQLKDKTVLVRGKVVKFSAAIMGTNWIHLRDGSGSAADNTNDILVTSADQTKVGDVVVVKGVVRTDKDFGSGYAYKVLVADAKLQQ
jgi:DNA/RNA endonuclease YhcR with UshA esterase domain